MWRLWKGARRHVYLPANHSPHATRFLLSSARMNHLYYGDNLDVLRRYIRDESVDLVYLDPPFKSNQDYNVLFAEKDGTGAAAQFKAFEDTWEWNQLSAAIYEEIVERGGRVSDVMQAFRKFLGTNDMLAYLTIITHLVFEMESLNG